MGLNFFIGLDKYVKQKNECPFCKKKALSSIKAGPNVRLQEMIQKSVASTNIQPPSLNLGGNLGFVNVTPSVNFPQLSFKDIQPHLNNAKYFIIKSSSAKNLERSVQGGKWATTKVNEVNCYPHL